MPVLKKNTAHVHMGASVRVPEFPSGTKSYAEKANITVDSSHTHGDAKLDLVRNSNGEIVHIKIRCGCGAVTNLDCDYPA